MRFLLLGLSFPSSVSHPHLATFQRLLSNSQPTVGLIRIPLGAYPGSCLFSDLIPLPFTGLQPLGYLSYLIARELISGVLGKVLQNSCDSEAPTRAGAFFGGGCALGRFEVRQEVAEPPGSPRGLCLARCPEGGAGAGCAAGLTLFPPVPRVAQCCERPRPAGGAGRGPRAPGTAGRSSWKKLGVFEQAGDTGRHRRWGTGACESPTPACLLSTGARPPATETVH